MPRVANLDEHVRESLRDQIMSGKLDGGAHLSELSISKEYNVSRTPVREALCALAADGLIEMIPHRGAFVREVNAVTAADQKTCYATFMGAAASFAAHRANIEMLMEVETSIGELSTKRGSGFGEALQKAFGSIRMAAQSGTLDESLLMLERRMNLKEFFGASAGQKETIINELNTMMAAIKRNKADVAEKAMRAAAAAVVGA